MQTGRRGYEMISVNRKSQLEIWYDEIIEEFRSEMKSSQSLESDKRTLR